MAKQLAPVESTSGTGYSFEEMVGAHFLALMLAGASPIAFKTATIRRIDFQTRADNWLLDDVLITMDIAGKPSRLSLSVRSNAQFSQSTAPADFVLACWEQYLGLHNCKFDREHDLMGLVTGPQPGTVFNQLHALLAKSREQDSADFVRRLNLENDGSVVQRSLFASFNCPEQLNSGEFGSEAGAGLLQRLWIAEFDYQCQPSNSAQQSQLICQRIVTSESQDDALRLWDRLLAVARQQRHARGYIDLRKLLREIQPAPRLLEHPSCAQSLRTLKTWSHAQVQAVPNLIGGRVGVDRREVVDGLVEALRDHSSVVLLGESGSGKSVIARSWADSCASGTTLLWVPPVVLSGGNLDDFRQRVGLAEQLDDVLPLVPDDPAYIVIDGLDRVATDDGARSLGHLLRLIHPSNQRSPWRIVATCQAEQWDRLQILMASAGVTESWKEIRVELPDSEQLSEVWQAFPALNFVRRNRHLGELIRTPKVLDLLATGCTQSGFDTHSKRWVGESDLVGWYWNTIVGSGSTGLGRKQFLMQLGERQADEGIAECPLPDLQAGPPLESLMLDRVLSLQENRVSFNHDLLADWSREQSILAHSHNLIAYLESRIRLPYWHRAIRLFAIHLLEQRHDTSDWLAVIEKLPATTDLFLDAAVFAANASAILERLWPLLSGNDAVLLRRLLKRFHYVATLPHPGIAAMASPENADLVISLRASFRVPYGPYWIPLLSFLFRHQGDVIALAKTETASILRTWLLFAPPPIAKRKEAAKVALSLAERHLLDRAGRGYDRDAEAQLPFEAAMAAATDLPDETAAFARLGAGRIKPDQSSYKPKNYIPAGASVRTGPSFLRRQLPKPEPWPEGPYFRLDEAFQTVVLSQTALLPLIQSKPAVASEIILSSLIDDHRPSTDDNLGSPLPDRELGLAFFRGHHPPFFGQGPFLIFLKTSPKEAIDCIARLVGFATERWIDKIRRENAEPSPVNISLPGGDKVYYGDENVFYWFAHSAFCPDSVVSALMAVEKWFYDLLDAKQPIEEWCKRLLDQSASVAILGLLLEIGRRETSLFRGILRPLLSAAELYVWEHWGQLHNVHGLKTIGMELSGKSYVDTVTAWNAMPHRKVSIRQIALGVFMSDPTSTEFFAITRAGWQERLKSAPASENLRDCLDNLVAWFDPENWQAGEHNGKPAIVFNPPAHLVERAKKFEAEWAETSLPLFLPPECRRRIDENRPLAAEELDKWWKAVQDAAAIYTRQPTDPKAASALVGAIGVVFILNRDWLRSRPEFESWAVGQLECVILRPPQLEIRVATSIDDWGWDAFCAEVIPVLWSESPSSARFRLLIAHLATTFHYRSVGRLCRACFAVREKLGDGFWQLWHFITRWAAVRDWLEDQFRKDNEIVDVKAWFDKYGELFISGRLSPSLPRWAEVSSLPARLWGGGHNHLTRLMRFDRELMMYAFSWLPNIKDCNGPQERPMILAFWHEVFGSSVDLLRSFDEAGQELADDQCDRGMPYEFDKWAMARAATLIPQLNQSENPDAFWKPLFNFGSCAHQWIEDFLFEWFGKNLTNDVNFVRRWKEMIAFAKESPSWGKWGESDLSCDLLGFGRWTSRCWQDVDSPTVVQMGEEYAAWTKTGLKSVDSAAQFVSWVNNPVAKSLRLSALVWLNDAAVKLTGDRHYAQKLRDSLGKLLLRCWHENHEQMRSDAAVWSAFHTLLQRLADTQHPVALEVQQLIAQHSVSIG